MGLDLDGVDPRSQVGIIRALVAVCREVGVSRVRLGGLELWLEPETAGAAASPPTEKPRDLRRAFAGGRYLPKALERTT